MNRAPFSIPLNSWKQGRAACGAKAGARERVCSARRTEVGLADVQGRTVCGCTSQRDKTKLELNKQ